jgi:hypothetical protein
MHEGWSEAALPRVSVRDPEAGVLRVLREAQYVLLKHPVAAQAAFSALVAEGRRFAATPEGREWSERLAGSELMRQGRMVWEVATLKILEESSPHVLPSAYVEALVKASGSRELESLLSRLFLEGAGDVRSAA